MKLMPVTGTYAPTIESDTNGSFVSYHVVPTEYTKVATFTSSTDAVIGSSVQSTYRAYIDSNKPAGTYAGKVRYSLVHPNDAAAPAEPQTTQSGKICYYANASDAVGNMGCQDIVKEKDWSSCYVTDYETYCYDENYNQIDINTLPELDTYKNKYTLFASNFSRDGYGFAGWSDAYDYVTNENAHFYGPSETITLTPADYQSPNNGLSLYAVWVKSEGNLQGWSGCSSLTQADTATNILSESITALSDSRDNNTYAIAKLADGKCWMIENLRLESTNSDNSTGALAQGYGTSATYGNFSGLATAESPWNNGITTANSLYYSGTQSGTATINIGTGSNPGYRFPRYNHDNTNSRASTPTTNTAAMYSYGNYYTWHAAIADTTAYTTSNQSVTNTSLCPAGWHLPKGGNKSNEANNEFWSLVVTGVNEGVAPANYSSSTSPYYTGTAEAGPVDKKLRSYPNNFIYSGGVDSGSVNFRGSGGYFWSSTANSSYNAYSLYLLSSNVNPGTGNYYKYSGRTVRCVASGA